jgi:hypothetical protein
MVANKNKEFFIECEIIIFVFSRLCARDIRFNLQTFDRDLRRFYYRHFDVLVNLLNELTPSKLLISIVKVSQIFHCFWLISTDSLLSSHPGHQGFFRFERHCQNSK